MTVIVSTIFTISIIFGTRCTELICNITVIDLPTLHTYWCCTTLGNIKCCSGFSSKGLTEQSRRWMHKTICATFVSWPPNSPDLYPIDCRMGHDAGSCVSDTSSRRNRSETALDRHNVMK